jgi:hypothetical protein
MDPADLERLLDAELRRLPVPRAPQTLLPRVMAAVRPAEAVSGWSTWPRAWQTAAAILMLAAAAGAAWLATAPPAPVAGLAERAGDTAALIRVLWDVLLGPAAAYLFVLGIALTLACAAAWAALELALGGASQR